MTARSRFIFVCLWFVSLIVVGAVTAAQTRREGGAVIAGENIGFRPEGWNGRARSKPYAS